MFQKSYDDNSKKFMQKILLFIDSTLLNATNSEVEETNKVLFSGLINIRDAIFSEIVKDNYLDAINEAINQKNDAKKNQEDLNQEEKLASDQQA